MSTGSDLDSVSPTKDAKITGNLEPDSIEKALQTEDVEEEVKNEKACIEMEKAMEQAMERTVDANLISTAFRDEFTQVEGENERFLSVNHDDKVSSELREQKRKIQGLLKELRQFKKYSHNQQAAIDLIMAKYREQISELTRLKMESDLKAATARKIALQMITEENRKRLEKLEEMKHVLQAALNTDEDIFIRNEELISQLAVENKNLRQLLAISGDTAATLRSLSKNMEDKSNQTDDCEDEMLSDHIERVIITTTTSTQTGSGDMENVTEEAKENDDSEEYCSDDSSSFYSAVDIDSDSCS